jgi:hypothetical protein
MTNSTRQRISGALLAVALVGAAAVPPAADAFNKVWAIVSCTNVSGTEAGFWDDMPGAGTGNESGLFWIVTNSTLNERCTANASGQGVSTTTYPELRVRMAVNDGATVTVQLRSGSEFCGGGLSIASIVTTAAEAHSGFITRTVALPSGRNVADVCVTINDNPDTVASQRASVLIDDIRIWNPATSAVGWRETFSRAN